MKAFEYVNNESKNRILKRKILTHCVMWNKNLSIFRAKELRSTISKKLIVVKAPQYVKENSVDN